MQNRIQFPPFVIFPILFQIQSATATHADVEGEYTLTDSDAEERIEIVCCDTCTLGLRIIYPEKTTVDQNKADLPR